jgi:hypothetical protein
MRPDLLDGVMTVTTDYTFGGGNGNSMQGTEELVSSVYAGEGFRCSMHGGWDKAGVRHVYDHCFGYGTHLAGWQYETHVVNDGSGDVLTGVVYQPGD